MTKVLNEVELSEIENQYAEFSKVVGDLIATIRAKDAEIERLRKIERVARMCADAGTLTELDSFSVLLDAVLEDKS